MCWSTRSRLRRRRSIRYRQRAPGNRGMRACQKCNSERMALVLVLVDSREPQSIIDALSAVYSVAVSQLAAGDVNVPTPNGLLAIERKTPSDLLSSIGDGRLFDQARAMVESVRFPLIVVNGSLLYNQDDCAVADERDTQWRGVSVRAAIRAV